MIRPEDSVYARERNGSRGVDASAATPGCRSTSRRNPQVAGPCRDEIELPARGPDLRDRYVLRLIAVDRAIHVVVLITLAVVLFTFAGHDASLHATTRTS